MGYSISQLFSICWVTFEFLIALGGIGGTVYLLVELGKMIDRYRKIAKILRPLLYLELENNSRKYAKNILCYLVKS